MGGARRARREGRQAIIAHAHSLPYCQARVPAPRSAMSPDPRRQWQARMPGTGEGRGEGKPGRGNGGEGGREKRASGKETRLQSIAGGTACFRIVSIVSVTNWWWWWPFSARCALLKACSLARPTSHDNRSSETRSLHRALRALSRPTPTSAPLLPATRRRHPAPPSSGSRDWPLVSPVCFWSATRESAAV